MTPTSIGGLRGDVRSNCRAAHLISCRSVRRRCRWAVSTATVTLGGQRGSALRRRRTRENARVRTASGPSPVHGLRKLKVFICPPFERGDSFGSHWICYSLFSMDWIGYLGEFRWGTGHGDSSVEYDINQVMGTKTTSGYERDSSGAATEPE